MALIDELRKNPTYAGFSDDEIADGIKAMKPEYADFSTDEVKAVISEPGSEAFLPSMFSTPGEAPPEATWGERIADVGIDVAKMTVGAGQALAGLAGLATGGLTTRGLRALGYDPEYTQQFLSDRYSPARKAEEGDISRAEGFIDTAGALATNPAALTGRVIESGPLMLGAMGVARAVGLRAYTSAYQTALKRGMTPADAVKVATDASARASTIAAAATEGGLTAGMTFEELDREGVELGRAYVAALGTGATTAAIGGVTGTVGRRIGLGDVEAGVGASGSLPVRALKGAAQEGALEEMPQSATEQMWQNYARERDLMERVPEAAATGLVVGGAAGAGFGAMRRPGAGQPAAGDQRGTEQPDMGEVDAATPVAQPAAAAQVTPEQAAQETAAALEAEDYFEPDEYPADFDVYGRTMYDLADDLEDIEPGLADDIIGRGIAAGLTEHDIITEIQGALRERTPFATRAGARTPAQEPSRRPTTAPQGRPQPAGATQQEVAPPAKPPAAPGPAAFTPTHELPDGTPVIATDEPNVWVDAEGNEYEDNYAQPIQAAGRRAHEGQQAGRISPEPAPRQPVAETARPVPPVGEADAGRADVTQAAPTGEPDAQRQPVDFPITENPKGSITVQGDPEAIRAALQAAGVTHKGIKDKNGIRFSKAHADVVRRALSEAPPARQGDRRQHDVPVPEDRRQGERRKDTATRKRLDDMTPEEMRAEIEALRAERLTNRKSGLPNMDAYDQDADLGWAHAGAADMDGMGFYNEVFGHIPTDELIRAVGQVLARHANDRVRFYHFNGDEFAARAASREDLDAAFAEAQAELDRMEVTITGHVPDGPQVKVKIAGIGITYGLGQSYEEADADASARKETRAASGERAKKGTNTGRVEVLGEGEQGGVRLGQRGESKEVTVARLKGEYQEPAPTEAGVSVSGTDVDAAAAEAATHPDNDLPEPTDAQKEAGNYRKGHVTLHGLDISIENPRGSERSGIDPGGQRWSITMKHHYGYIRGTVGRDKDHLDVFLGQDPERADLPVFIIDQVNPETGRFDEHKILLGFKDEQAAREGYLANYEDNWGGLGGITQMSLDEFKAWLREGDTTKRLTRRNEEPVAQEADAIGPAWDAMTRDERIAAAMRAGWFTRKGKPNFVARRLSKQKWAEINENTQRILREKGGIQAGTTTPTGPTTTPPGERVNGAVERAAAERLEQLWEQRPAVSRATPEGAAYGAIRSVFEELRKPRTAISVEAVLEQASQRLMRKYPDASDVVDEVIESLKAGERADTDVTDLNAMFGELLEEEVQARKKAQAPRERKPAAEQKPATERKPRTAGEHAKEAARETAKGLDAALDGLAALFGSKGRLGSGPVFDEETYAKAKPLFQEAIKHFTDAADNVREAMRLVIRALLDRFQDPDMVKRMQPYVVRFIEDVQTGKPVEEDTDAQPDTERPDRRAPRSEGALGQRGLDFDRPAQADLEGLAGDAAEDDGAPGRKGRRGAGDRVPGEDVGGRGTLPEDRDAADRREGAGREGAPDDGARGRERGRPNYHITDAERLIGGSPKVRFARNRKAIEALEAITAEGREPTQDELDAMAGYIGWGSFGQELFKGTFDRTIPKDGWQEESDWIKDHLGREAWESAQASIINAHYTDPITVGAMWDMVRQLGFKGGRVLEPSMGVGNFFGLMPRDLMERSQLAGIELDKTTGAMAKLLYPEANIQIKGYEASKTADNFYDLVIGNWPFAKETPFVDRRYMNLNPSLHDYFFLKALDQVRPGGLVVGITSAGTMDKQSARVRAALAEKAELVGAFRLPSGAFEKYAGTSVVTDIIILQKREKPIKDVKGEGWISTTEVDTPAGETIKVNEYFANNRDKVLGTLNFGSGSTYGRPAMIVDRPPDLEQRLKAVAGTLPKDVMTDRKQVDNTRYITNNTKDRQQSATIGPDGGIYVVKGEYLAPLEDVIRYKLKDPKKTAEREDQIRALIAMRRAYGTLIDTEREGGEDTESKRKALRAQYEAFVKSYGALNDSQGLTILRKIGDPFYPSLAALETPKGEPAAILSRPTVRTRRRMERPTIRDALVLARNESLDIDIERVAELAGVSVEQAARELIDAGQVFQTPAGNYEVRDVYLSGNVRRKLREAEAAKEAGMDMDANIEALQRVLPKDIPYFNIDAKMGATWIRPEHYRQFISELLGVSPDPNAIEVRWVVNRWKVKFHDRALNQRPEATTTWGYGAVRFDHLLSSAMGNVAVKVWTLDENKNRVVDEEASKEANEKVNRLREEFSDWVWRDPARRIELERSYNEVMNAIATPDYDGSFLTFEGMALQRGDSPFNLRRHQVNAIWRGLANGRGIYGHEVGTGKTYTMGGIAVESRRYGIAKKPIIFAHNANSASVAREIGEMYPAAKILYVDNLDPSRIDVIMRQIANDDWDAVVVPHSLIDRFALSEETLNDLAREEIEALEMEAIEAAKEDDVELTVGMMDDEEAMKKVRSVTAKQLVHARNAILKRIAGMAARSSRDNAVPFESMGIDMIIVDEAHEFKKPPIATRMMMRGLNKATSQQSLSLMLLTDYVKRINGGRGVHVFTGTPITNTINEIYNMQRYVMDDQMQRDGVRDWDGWFSAFADSTSDVELTATGEYEPVTRLAAFVNVAELRRMAGQYMDIVFADDMPEFRPRQTASGKTIGDRLSETEQDELLNGRTEHPVGRPYKKIIADTEEMSPQQAEIMAELQTRASIFRRASKKDRREMMLQGSKNVPIRVETDAANAGLDARLFDMNAADHPKSKVNRAVGNIVRHFKEHPLSTQVVFVERGYTSEAVIRRKDPETGQVHVRKTPRFNLVEDMIEKLVAQGIPRHQIAVVDGSVSKEKRKLIADKMNTAEIRVVIGSTKTLGVGVNMQENLRAMHHLDAPWMPGELEQRNGRGHRQGNKWNTVLEYRYITERIDGRRWQVLAIKDRFIKAFLKADESVRVIEGDAVSLEEDNDIGATLSEAAGDPRILLINKLKADVQRLENKERMHSQGVYDAKRKIAQLEREIAETTQAVKELREVDSAFRAVVKGAFTATVGARTYTKTEEANEALARAVEKIEVGKTPFTTLGDVWGFTIKGRQTAPFSDPQYLIQKGDFELWIGKPTIESVRQTLYGIATRINAAEERIADAKGSIPRMEEAAKAPFGREEDLKKKRKLLADIEADLQANPVPAPAWLRNGAPVGSEVTIGKGSGARVGAVEGHRWTADGYLVTVTDKDGQTTDVNYLDVTDLNGMPLYEARPFTPPVIATATSEQPAKGAMAVREEVALYSGYERAEDAVQGWERTQGGVQSPVGTGQGQLALFDPEELPAEADAARAQLADNFLVRYRQVPVAQIRVGFDTITTPEEAAHVAAQLRKAAQEEFLVIATDANGKILNVIRHTKGLKDSSSVDPTTVLAAIAATDDAAQVWFAHNHPSGVVEPSGADETITNRLIAGLDGTDIEFKGHVIVGTGKTATLMKGLGGRERIQIKPAARLRTLTITERAIRKQPPSERAVLNSSSASMEFVRSMESDSALLLLDTRYRMAGIVSLTSAEMARLREGGRVRRILRAIDTTNASAAIIVSNNEKAAKNVAHFLGGLGGDMRILDGIIREPDGSLYSLSERGETLSGGVFLARGTEAGRTIADEDVYRAAEQAPYGMKAAKVEAITANVALAWGSNAPNIRVFQSVRQAPTWITSQISERDYGLIRGAHDRATGDVYLFADNLKDAREVHRILAHEAVGHAGMEEIVDRGEVIPGGWDAVERRMGFLVKSGNKQARALYDEVRRLGYDMDNRAVVTREMLAIAAERHVTDGLIGRLVRNLRAAVRNFLRKLGINSLLPAADIDAMVVRSLRYLRESGGRRAAIPAVLEHPQLGDIDVATGRGRTGLSRFAKTHPEITRNLEDLIAGSKVVSRDAETATLENGGATFDLIKKAGRWVLTDARADFARSDDTVRLYHGGNAGLVEISGDLGPGNIFGGIFASPSRSSAASHGDGSMYVIDLPESAILTQSALDYEIDPDAVRDALMDAMPGLDEADYDIAYEAVIEDRSDRIDPGDLVRVFGGDDTGEAAWEAQRIRGQVARILGYQAVEMSDEHGASYLVLPGAKVVPESGDIAGNVGTFDPESEGAIVSGEGEDLVTLYHGTSKESADSIRESGRIEAGRYFGGIYGVSLTPRREIAEEYADDGEVIVVKVPRSKLVVDPESYDSRDVEKALSDGASVYATGPILIRSPNQPRDLVKARSGPTASGLDFSRAASMDILTEASTRAGEVLADLLKRPGVFGPLARTLQTQYHKATKSPQFRAVWERAHAMFMQSARAMSRPASLAPTLLPKFDTSNFMDALKATVTGRGHVAPADIAAAAEALNAGTLYGGPSPLEGRVFTPDELRDGVDLEDGRTIRLTDTQIRLYLEARAAIDASLTETAAAEAWGVVKQYTKDARLRQLVAEQPHEAEGMLMGLLKRAKEDAAAELRRMARNASDAVAEIIHDTGITPAEKLERLRALPARDNAERAAAQAAVVADLTDSQARVGAIFSKSRALQKAGYVPLMRFGRYRVSVVMEDEAGVEVEFVARYESAFEANRARRKLIRQYPAEDGYVVSEVEVMNDEKWRMFQGVNPETVMLFAEEAGIQADEVMQSWYKEAVSNRSALRRMVHRKGYAGFSEDLPRVLASFITSNGKRVGYAYHLGDMQRMINQDMPGDVQEEAQKLLETITNPERGMNIRGLMATWYLLGSAASSMVNMTQTLTMSLPWLAQYGKGGFAPGQASKAMVSAYKQIMGTVREDTRAALKRAEEEGVVDSNEVFHLYAEAMKPMISKLGSGRLAYRARAFMTVWGAPFAIAEKLNRKATFIAAYQMAMENGKTPGEAFQFAEKAVIETQGIYSAYNRPNWARGPIGGAVMTFKQFSIAYVEMLARMAKAGPEGQKAALLALAILFFFAGASGLPGEDDLLDIIDTFAQVFFGKATVSRLEIRNALHEALGETMGDFVNYGISAFLPLDVSARLGLGNLLPGTAILKPSEPNKAAEAMEALGVAGSFGRSLMDGASALLQGEIGRAARVAAPKAVGDVLKGLEMATTGEARDMAGRKIIEASAVDAFVQAIGFQPATKGKIQRSTYEIRELIGYHRMVERGIVIDWARGVADGDRDKIAAARRRLEEWNANNHDLPIRINMKQIWMQVRQLKMEKTGRIEKTAPREIRRQVMEMTG